MLISFGGEGRDAFDCVREVIIQLWSQLSDLCHMCPPYIHIALAVALTALRCGEYLNAGRKSGVGSPGFLACFLRLSIPTQEQAS